MPLSLHNTVNTIQTEKMPFTILLLSPHIHLTHKAAKNLMSPEQSDSIREHIDVVRVNSITLTTNSDHVRRADGIEAVDANTAVQTVDVNDCGLASFTIARIGTR